MSGGGGGQQGQGQGEQRTQEKIEQRRVRKKTHCLIPKPKLSFLVKSTCSPWYNKSAYSDI